MRQATWSGFAPLGAIVIGAVTWLGGCSAADVPSSACRDSSTCDRGFACTTQGQCDRIDCTSDADCIEGEACLQADRFGQYAPSVPGFCTATECSEGRGGISCPDGQACIGGLCYVGGGGPATCACNTDCPAGQACLGGTCAAPAATCASDCECAVGSVCTDGSCTPAGTLCGGEVCGAGETCVADVCTPSTTDCNPPCGPGQTCNTSTGTCEGGGADDFLCDTCTNDSDCGGPDDRCVALTGGNSICGKACTGASDCPSGYSCTRVDSRSGEQCIPLAGECSGCLQTGCPSGQFCNGVSTECEPILSNCANCVLDAQCGAGSGCALAGGTRSCLNLCSAGTCAAGTSCQAIGGVEYCVPDGGSCAGPCTRSPSECTGVAGRLNPTTCTCVECVTVADCGANQVCSDDGQCIVDGAPCSRITDCPVGFICDTRPGVGRCVQCITPGDCATGEICRGGLCQACSCPPGQRCTLTGECVATGNPDDCSGPSDCVGLYNDLGGDPAQAGRVDCDAGGVGCYLAGSCNGNLFGGGVIPIPIELPGFGGTVDPFDAACPPGTTCEIDLNIFGLIGGGDAFGFACSGCDTSNPDACREGEVCQEPLLPILGSGAKCVQGSGGGGGFPFPFPFPF